MSITQYRTFRIKSLSGNPLAEAIPKRLDEDSFIDKISREFEIPDDISEFDDEEKEFVAKELATSFIVTSNCYEFYQDLHGILVNGYAQRNPLSDEFKKHQHLVATGKYVPPPRTTSENMIFTGYSGMGKSTLVDSVVALYDPKIPHTPEGKYDISFDQIPILKCNIKNKADLKEICLAIFKQYDAITGDNLAVTYRKSTKSQNDCVDRLITLCTTQIIGMLIFDEFQNISLQRSTGLLAVITFFESHINEAKIPVLKVGTTKSLKLFEGQFTNQRRLGLPFELVNFVQEDEDWETLVDYAWHYQVVGDPLKLTEDIQNKLHELTCGIPYCLSFLMERANIYAVRKNKNSIDADILDEVYRKDFGILRAALLALRDGNRQAFDDLMVTNEMLVKNAKIAAEKLIKVLKENIPPKAKAVIKKQLEKLLPECSHMLTNRDKAYIKKLKQEEITLDITDDSLDELPL